MDPEDQANPWHVGESLGLPLGDKYTQDWVYELPAEYRTISWFKRYLGELIAPASGAGRRQVLMKLVLDVADDLFGDGQLAESDWKVVERELLRAPALYNELVEHWRLDGEPLEDCFAITPLIRQLPTA